MIPLTLIIYFDDGLLAGRLVVSHCFNDSQIVNKQKIADIVTIKVDFMF